MLLGSRYGIREIREAERHCGLKNVSKQLGM